MSTPLERAEQAVAEKRGHLHRGLLLVAAGDEVLPEALDAGLDELIAAVRRHDAELVRSDTDHIPYGSATEYAERHAALIDPDKENST